MSRAFADTLRSWDADPRFYDRLLTVCTVLLAAALAVVVFLMVQPMAEFQAEPAVAAVVE